LVFAFSLTRTNLAVALLPVSVLKYSNDNLTVIVEPTSGILRAAWARPLLTANLIDSYYHLLQEAEANGSCRFWHLDLRMSIWPAATFMSWLSETYAPVATQRLGGSVYAAFWVAAEHQPQVDDAVTTAMLARANAAGFYPVFFDNEPAARAWLLEQQAQDGLATRP
jgi:hypothetical protein